MFELPDIPSSDDRILHGEFRLRYEDISQDRRAKLNVLPASLGVVWRAMIRGSFDEMKLLRAEGIVPVLRRFVLVGTDTPVGVQHPLTTQGRFQTAHLTGSRTRFVLNMRTDMSAPRASIYPPPPSNAGVVERVGSVFAEHVYTRIFAPPAERRVERLPEGVDPGPALERVELSSLMTTDGDLVDPEPVEQGDILFGLTHTDSNQHVNSLVYPQLFEERTLEAWGEGCALARSLHIIWRKPSFAGERATVRIQRISKRDADGETRGAIASLWAEGEVKPRCAAQLFLG